MISVLIHKNWDKELEIENYSKEDVVGCKRSTLITYMALYLKHIQMEYETTQMHQNNWIDISLVSFRFHRLPFPSV